MVDVSITAASVLAASSATTEHGTAGASITAGQVVYKEAATGLFKLADANSAAESKTPYGIAMHAAATGQPLDVCTAGAITVGGTLVAGTAYYLSPTPGGIKPSADLTTGDYVGLLGLAASTTVLNLRIQVPGVTL